MYTLDATDLSTYGIVAGRSPGSNISVKGFWDMPKRIGDTHYSWDDEDGLEPYTEAGDLFYAGRDISFYGYIFGADTTLVNYLISFYSFIDAFTDLVVFSTPYGDRSVQVKNVDVKRHNGGISIVINFREPVATLSGGTLPAVGTAINSFDDIPFKSFGLYMSKAEALHDMPELKSQYFTKYGSEGYQIVKRKAINLVLNCHIIASSIADFQAKIKALYKLVTDAGTININISDVYYMDSFLINGFTVDNIYLYDTAMVASFKCDFTVTERLNLVELLDEIGLNVLTEAGESIIINV